MKRHFSGQKNHTVSHLCTLILLKLTEITYKQQQLIQEKTWFLLKITRYTYRMVCFLFSKGVFQYEGIVSLVSHKLVSYRKFLDDILFPNYMLFFSVADFFVDRFKPKFQIDNRVHRRNNK